MRKHCFTISPTAEAIKFAFSPIIYMPTTDSVAMCAQILSFHRLLS